MEPYNSIEDLLLSSISKANEVGVNYENEMGVTGINDVNIRSFVFTRFAVPQRLQSLRITFRFVGIHLAAERKYGKCRHNFLSPPVLPRWPELSAS